MVSITIVSNSGTAWTDLPDKQRDGRLLHTQEPIQVGLVPGGMASGAASVALRLDCPDGRVLVAETSLTALAAAVRALETMSAGLPLRIPSAR